MWQAFCHSLGNYTGFCTQATLMSFIRIIRYKEGGMDPVLDTPEYNRCLPGLYFGVMFRRYLSFSYFSCIGFKQ